MNRFTRHLRLISRQGSVASRLFEVMSPFWRLSSILLLFQSVAIPLSLLSPLPLKIAVDSALGDKQLPAFIEMLVPAVIQKSSTHLLALSGLLLICVAVARQLQSLFVAYIKAKLQREMLLRLRSRLFQHAQRLSFSYHDNVGASDISYRIFYDAVAIPNILTETLMPFIVSAGTVLAMLYIVFRLNWILGAIAISITPIMALLTARARDQLRNDSRRVKAADSAAYKVISEALNVFRVVKSFGQESREENKFLGKANEELNATLDFTMNSSRFGLLLELTTAFASGLTLFVGGALVLDRRLSLGNLLLVLSYISQLYAPIKTVSSRAARVQSNIVSAERALSLLDVPRDVAESPHPLPLARCKGSIHFENVTYGYLGKEPVLQDVSFAIPAGSRVGVIGRSGSGKTTLLNLLPRFFDPSTGRILLDGIDIRRYRLSDLRNQFSIVLQDTVLFSTSIADNIAYGRPDAPHEAIQQAAIKANAHGFISNLPMGYDSVVGHRGMSLSGGERQRISIARAFLRDSPILILDEPTSALDTDTESQIIDSMANLMEGRTTFIVAHRQSTLVDCDLILRVINGNICLDTETLPLHD